MPVSTAIVWLKAASAVLMIGLGLLFAISAWPPASGLVTFMVDMLFWPLDGAQSLPRRKTRIILAIGGGIYRRMGRSYVQDRNAHDAVLNPRCPHHSHAQPADMVCH